MHLRFHGWTLSETLVMMIIAGIVFLSVMDGMMLFNRFAAMKTRQIERNMSLWEGYYHLRDLTATADSVSAENGSVRLFREGKITADLFETDFTLVVRIDFRIDTLMFGVSALTLAGSWEQTGTDTVRVEVRGQGGNILPLSFPVSPPPDKFLVKNLSEQEKIYDYE